MLKKLIFFFAWIGIFLISLVALNYILLPGQIVYDSTLKKGKLWNGTAWVNLDGTALA